MIDPDYIIKHRRPLCSIQGVDIYVDMWIIVIICGIVWLCSKECGLLYSLLYVGIVYASVIGHEMAHMYITSKQHGVSDIMILSLNGAAVRSCFDYETTVKQDAIRALAGPVFNLIASIVGIFIYMLYNTPHNGALMMFIIINMLAYIINMLPVYGNDGYKIYKYIASVM